MDDAMKSGRDGTEADDNFHIAMAKATHNAYVSRLVEFLGRHFSDSRKLAWHGTSHQLGLPHESQREHRALLEAISRGDAEAARRCALEHLRGAASRLGIPWHSTSTASPGRRKP
jgi:GntR family transcriptional repressor for pyruvate dehydrogenase complex